MTDSERATPTLYSCSIDTLSILNGIDVIRLFKFGWDFPTGGKIVGVFGRNDPQNVKLEKITCWEGTSLCQSASFEPLCVKLSLSVWPVQVRKKKRQEGRKEEKSQEVYISRMCGATRSGRIPTKFGTYVCLMDIIKRAKFHRYNVRGFGAERC